MSANVVPPCARSWLLDQIKTAGGLKVQLLDGSWTYDASAVHLSDIASGKKRGSATAIAGTITTTTYGGRAVLTTSASTAVASVATGANPITALAVTFDDGSGDRILCYLSRRSDRTAFAITADGGDVIVSFPGGRIIFG